MRSDNGSIVSSKSLVSLGKQTVSARCRLAVDIHIVYVVVQDNLVDQRTTWKKNAAQGGGVTCPKLYIFRRVAHIEATFFLH